MKVKWKRHQPCGVPRDNIFGSPAGYTPDPLPLYTCEAEDGFSAKLVRLEGSTPVYHGTVFLDGEELKTLEIHCNLRDSKEVIAEKIIELATERSQQAA